MKENNPRRRIGIVIAVILGLVASLYLGGLLGQMITGYRDFMDNDGMMGGVEMPPVNPAFLYCLGNASTSDGLTGTCIVIAAAAAIVIYIKLHDKFKNKDLDDRNFIRSKAGTYGTAGWMTSKEMKNILEVTTPDKAEGIILGKKGGSVVCLPADTMLNKHLCVFGASGTMKSRAIIRPYLFQSLKRGESVICTDPKGELYSDTAEMFRRKGYKVRVFNLTNPDHSDSWNCMADLEGDTMMAQILTNVIISNTGKGKADHFWDNGEGNLLKSLILYVDQDNSRSPDMKHLPAVYQMLTQNTEKSLSAIFDKLPVTHPAKAPYNLFAQSSDTVRAGIVLGLGTRLQVLQNLSIKNITSKHELDLSEPGKTKCAYFVILSDQESSTEFISSLFFSFLFIKLARYADSTPNQRCEVPVNIVFDEFNNVGALDTYPRRLSVCRSRFIQCCHVVQSLAQFKNRYPDEQWAEIIGNCDTQVMLGCTEEQTAEYFSARSGDMTVDVRSTMIVKKTIAVAQMIPQYRESEGLGKRRLLTPDEVFRLPNNEMLIIIRGEKILRADKFDFTGHPYAKRMIKASIFDYYPEENKKTCLPQTETKNRQKELNILTQPPLYQTETEIQTGQTQHAGRLKKSPINSQSDRTGGRVKTPDYAQLLKSFKPQPSKASKQPLKNPSSEAPREYPDNPFALDGNLHVAENPAALLSEDHYLYQPSTGPPDAGPGADPSEAASQDPETPDDGLAELASISMHNSGSGGLSGDFDPPDDF